jgi:catechol 2,3-dioxygenase-like lactoylglutathione lyase family enzyme
MTISGVLAQATVNDLARSEDWYTRVLGREPDARPMAGLLEWHWGDNFGVQVWAEPQRAGRSTMVLTDSDLDALVVRLRDAGISTGGAESASSSRILQLADPDGNRVVFAGP